MTDAKTIADELRKAAALLRETAIAAIAGPWASLDGGDRLVAWRTGDDFEYVVDEPIDGSSAEWMALVNPLLAEPLASWLERVAEEFGREVITDTPECPNCGEGCHGHADALVHDDGCGNWLADPDASVRCTCFDAALAVAHVLNGTAS